MNCRTLRVICLFSCLVLVLGCNSNEEPEKAATPSTTAETADTSQTASPTIYPSPFDGGTLRPDPSDETGQATAEVVVEETEETSGGGIMGAFGRAFLGGVADGMKETE